MFVRRPDGHKYAYSLDTKASAIHDQFDERQANLFNSSTGLIDQKSILDRLDRIEAALGIGQDDPESASLSQVLSREEGDDSVPEHEAWGSVAHLRSITHPAQDEKIWSRPIVKRLWNS